MLSLFLLTAALVLSTVYYSVSFSAQDRLEESAKNYLTRLVGSLDAVLARHSYLPVLLAEEPVIQDFLQKKPTALSTEALNMYLERINKIAGTLDIYLMLANGDTVAASNWAKEQSFIGKNFAFRPYFQQAIQGQLGRYYAVGTTSNERGYYFAYPISDEEDRSLGVITVKVNVAEIEALWQSAPIKFLVTDSEGIIFLASDSEWLFKTIKPLPELRRQAIRDVKRYLEKPLMPLEDFRLVALNPSYQQAWLKNQSYLLAERNMETAGWQVYVLLDWKEITSPAATALAVAAVLWLLTSLLVLLLWKNQSQRRRYKQAAMEALESKVEERTRELRLAQEGLVQATKMAALGQLSAAINHELNNPLGAIRAYADNANQFLERGYPEIAKANLQEISALTERMATITRQLKIFSRKSSGSISDCHLQVALDSAFLIVRPKLAQTKVILHDQRAADIEWVKADLVWLEQILVNLLSNAIDAAAAQSEGQVWLTTQRIADKVSIQVRDNGAGIQEEDKPHLFEPFFTTKALGKGLGLGLSISYRLAKDMQGELLAENAPEGGAIFSLLLPFVETSLETQHD
ncbi:ATP-binding protein [uncultured Thiothrix sp.]|uniref:sensor histidine kinase n=1 Tax=uncultured Thiothrix sp. TaxID=223185 RepID=UPI0026207EEE|nr:ATP-binding protein [uncultured Thiothrix sp.]